MLPPFVTNKLLTTPIVRTNLSLRLPSRQKNFGPNYYTEKQWWITRKIKKLFMRFPILERALILGILFSTLAIPFITQRKKLLSMRNNLSDDEWADFTQKHKATTLGRLKFGQNLHLPFYNKDKALEQDEQTQKTFMDS
ncbi:hypothetical protein niasHS_000661 [Heterodera schachtii]|uniref:Uncharacterized protein n=2 Tax=Heterodera TaxID=34509 RepID=A0ABD2K4V8_HETSC